MHLWLLHYQQQVHVQGGSAARQELTALIRQRVMYSIGQHRALPIAHMLSEEVLLLKDLAVAGGTSTPAEAWQEQLRLVFELLLHASGEHLGRRTPLSFNGISQVLWHHLVRALASKNWSACS